jgi:hypothetical protein
MPRLRLVAIGVAVLALTTTRSSAAPLGKAAAERVPRYSVYEQTFDWPSGGYANPWEDVTVRFTAISPTGRRTTVGGFYAGGDTWKARFAPTQIGRWRWTALLSDGARQQRRSGTLVVERGSGHGFVRRNPDNRFRWTFSDGSPYYPLGIGDCVRDDDRSGKPFDDFYLDTHKTTLARYLNAYRAAGVNLFRWSVDNCAFSLYRSITPAGNVYLEREGDWGDELVHALRARGIRVYMTIFGFNPPYATNPTPPELAAIHRYVKYVVDRYGSYVDYWELMNEANASPEWYADVGAYLHAVDPYHHPVATSWERPDLPAIDVNSPHWYEREAESESDARTWSLISAWKSAGKPVIVGEQGNSGQNWDERSAVRMRLRAWTAFFAEGTLIFWNTSTTKDYGSAAANIYLGSQERRYLHVLGGFTRGFPRRARIVRASVEGPPPLRGYALSSASEFAAYLHASQGASSRTSPARLQLKATHNGTATWIDPATGRVLARAGIRAGTRVLTVPPFAVDVALKVRFRVKR